MVVVTGFNHNSDGGGGGGGGGGGRRLLCWWLAAASGSDAVRTNGMSIVNNYNFAACEREHRPTCMYTVTSQQQHNKLPSLTPSHNRPFMTHIWMHVLDECLITDAC